MQQQPDYSLISKVLENYWDFMKEIDGDSYITELIPESMLDKTRNHNLEYAYWKPIKSTITENEIKQLESLLLFPLPNSFKFFLQQNHFVELYLGGYSIGFFKNLPGKLITEFSNKITNYYPGFLERKLIPFADFSDFGVLCFNVQSNNDDHEYPIVMLTHEDGYEGKEFHANNFLSLFKEFDAHLLDWIQNSRSKKL